MLSVTQKRKQAQARRAASTTMLKKGFFRGPLGRIAKATRHPRTRPRYTETPVFKALARLAARRRQRQNKQIGRRVLRQWTREMIAESQV